MHSLSVVIFLISVLVLVPVIAKSRKDFHDEQQIGRFEIPEMPTTEWPAAVGRDADEVVASIKSEHPTLNVVKLKEGSPVTMDFRTDRVRVFYDAEGNVVGQPKVG
jgi:hypothetical protein